MLDGQASGRITESVSYRDGEPFVSALTLVLPRSVLGWISILGNLLVTSGAVHSRASTADSGDASRSI